MRKTPRLIAVALMVLNAAASAVAQERPVSPPSGSVATPVHGVIRGRVVLRDATTEPIDGATINLPGLGRVAVTDVRGRYLIARVPPGTHEIFAQRGNARSDRRRIAIAAGDTTVADFELAIAHTLEAITVTGNPRGQTTALEAFGAVTSVSARDLAERMSGSLGETLEGKPGVAKRSFGPGSARPIVRGFDGDRVLMMNDGLRSGDVSSQSGDHGGLTDPAGLKRVEILKGPATLLYGSNAIGGVVNAISYHDFTHEPPPSGLTGVATVDGGSADERAGGNVEFQYGDGGWVVWGGGGARRTGDYETPLGNVPNSASNLRRVAGGGGRHGPKAFLDGSASFEQGRYGVPFAAQFEGEDGGPAASDRGIEIDGDRTAWRLNAGLRELDGWMEDVHAHVTFIDWTHRELDDGSVGTVFRNESLIFRAEANQRSAGRLSGTVGLWGQRRSFEAVGDESLSPPVEQASFAVFALEEVDFEGVRLAGGLRFERNTYDVSGALPDRSFTAVSGSIGANVPIIEGAALYANLSHSRRAPALEELYNEGPHVGNLTFERGDANLATEAANGIDAGVRIQSESLNAEGGLFFYDIGNYIYLAPTGETEDGLPVGNYRQDDARYLGFEVSGDIRLVEKLRLQAGIDYVRADLTTDDAIGDGSSARPLPRIPPLRARLGLDWHVRGLDLRPELSFAAAQNRTFGAETTTDGYTLLGLTASYTFLRGAQQHLLSLRLHNIGDALYRNHTSFIKDLAPEVGRGVQLTYSVRFF